MYIEKQRKLLDDFFALLLRETYGGGINGTSVFGVNYTVKSSLFIYAVSNSDSKL
jgi:hypothetical protein